MSSRPTDPAALHALCEQGLQLHRAGRVEDAQASYERVLQLEPRHFNALHLLGALSAQLGKAEAGLALLQRALVVNPRSAAVLSLVGTVLEALGRREEALASFDRAIALGPDLLEANYNRAGLLQRWGRPRDALAAYDKVIALAPGLAEAYHNRGLVLEALGRPADAFASYDRAVALKPALADAWFNRGLMLRAPERASDALASFDRAIDLRPDFERALIGRGFALQTLGRSNDALAAIDRAIAIRPDNPDSHQARGRSLHELNRLEEAIASYDRALALAPDDPVVRFSRSLSLLALGRYEDGWRDYECRSARWRRPPRDIDPSRRWLGGVELAGKSLFLFHEQGFGDTLQFARYIPLLNEAGARVLVSVQDPLAPVLQQLCPSHPLLGQDETPASYDLHCSFLDLPRAFGTTLANIPAPLAYLSPDVDRCERFDRVLGPRNKPRIGVTWSGNARHENDRNRSMTFDCLAPLLRDDFEWICLQNEIREVDREALGRSPVRFLGEHLNDFADTAALVDRVDLVISVCTSVAHLAGALGKPVWLMLACSPDWRWMLDRTDSPWYPTARLFRQRSAGDWDGVVREIQTRLQSLAIGPARPRSVAGD